MKKKFLSIMACLAVILVGGVALSACGTTSSTVEPVTLVSEEVDAYGATTKWKNDDSLTITKTDTNTYNISGTASFMTSDQATAFGSPAEEGNPYVIFQIEFKVGETFYTGSDTSGSGVVNDTENDDYYLVLLRLPANDSIETTTRSYTIKSADGETTTTYTITFNGLTVTQSND